MLKSQYFTLEKFQTIAHYTEKKNTLQLFLLLDLINMETYIQYSLKLKRHSDHLSCLGTHDCAIFAPGHKCRIFNHLKNIFIL